jgi:hypothetical protein
MNIDESIYRRPCKDGDEVDAFSRKTRRALRWRQGEVRGIKARHNRRTRRTVNQAIRSGRI